MRTKAMNKGVQILLERMGSNPEEFYTANQKWIDVISLVTARMKHIGRGWETQESTSSSLDSRLSLCPLKDEEVIALHTKLKAIASEEFTHTVMDRLLTDKRDANYLTMGMLRQITEELQSTAKQTGNNLPPAAINYDSSVGAKLKAAIASGKLKGTPCAP